MARAFVGTSGFYYNHWKDGVFYPKGLPKKEWFRFYTSRFNTVELNSTFYRLPKIEVFKNWYKKAPKDFVFVLKGSRFISHIKKFGEVEEAWEQFWERARLLGEKLGPILFQTPPSWQKDVGRLRRFLEIVPRNVRFAFEFRNASWFDEEVYEILRNFGACLCFVSSPSWPTAEVVTSDFIYVRFHGEERLYASNYSEEKLRKWAEKFKKWLGEGKDVYAYFNNDALGYAPKNAEILKKLLERE